MPNRSLTLVVDEQGNYYRIPIACINDPVKYSYNPELEKLVKREKPAEVIFKVWQRNRYYSNRILK